MKWEEIKNLARKLRKNQTPEEAQLWTYLRNRKYRGIKFYRQHPIRYESHGKQRFFIADFYSREISMVIELDGKIHENQKDYDEHRDLIINNLGITVLRFDNDEFNNNIKSVYAKIDKHISNKSLKANNLKNT